MNSAAALFILVFLICFGGTVSVGKTKMVFKTSVRCKSAPRHWCYSFRFYIQDPVRTNMFLTPEIYTCTNDKIHTSRLFGTQTFDETSLSAYQVHFVTHHNCSTIEKNTWRTVDLHYKEVQVEPQRQKFRIRLDLTDNGQIEKNMTSPDPFAKNGL